MSRATVNVALCDDHEIYRRELLTALESNTDIHVVAEAEIPSGLGPIISDYPPDVVVVDLSPVQGDPAEIIANLSTRMPGAGVLAIGGPNDDLGAALVAGAIGAVDKGTALSMGCLVVPAVADGKLFLDRRAAQSLLRTIHAYPRRSAIPSSQVELVDRLTDVETIAELADDAFEGAKMDRELFALINTLRDKRRTD